MIIINQDAYKSGSQGVRNYQAMRMEAEKMKNDENHRQILENINNEKLNLDKQIAARNELNSRFENQARYANTLKTYKDLGIDPATGQASSSGNDIDTRQMAENIFNASGLSGENFDQSSKNMSALRDTAIKQYGEDSRSVFSGYPIFGMKGRYGKDQIDTSTFVNPEKLNNFFNTPASNKVRKAMGLDKAEWADYKQEALKYSQGASGVVNTMVDAMVKSGFLPSAQQIDLKTMNTLGEIATSANPKERFANYLQSLKTNKANLEQLEGKGGNSLGNFSASPVQNFYNGPQPYNPGEQGPQAQQAQQTQNSNQPTQQPQLDAQQSNSPEAVEQQVDNAIKQLPQEQQTKVVEARDSLNNNYDEILKRMDPVDRKQAEKFVSALKGEGSVSMGDSIFTGIGDGLRSLFNIGFKLGGSSLPPSEIMEKASQDNPGSFLLGNMIGMAAGTAPLSSINLGSSVPKGAQRLMGGLANGAIVTGAIHADDMNEKAYTDDKLGMVYDLIAPNNLLEGALAYGLPLVGGAIDLVASKGFKSGLSKGEELLNAESSAESIRATKGAEREIEGAKASSVKDTISDVKEASTLAKKNLKAETRENLAGLKPEEIYESTKAQYTEKIRPMETFSKEYAEELKNIPTQQERLSVINKLDELGVDPVAGANFGKDIGKLRGEVQNARTYDDFLKIYREINGKYSSDSESFYAKVGNPLKEELRDSLNEITGGKFNEANKAYEDALLIDKALGVSKRFRTQATSERGGTRADMIDRTISEKLSKAIDNPQNTRIRSLLAGGEEQLSGYAINKLGSLFNGKNTISTIENGLNKFANDFADVMEKPAVAKAFGVAKEAVNGIRGVEDGVTQLLTDFSKKAGAQNINVSELVEKFNAFSEKYLNAGEENIGLSRKFGDELVNNLDASMDALGQKYFNKNWDQVRADIMSKVMSGEPLGKEIETNLKRFMEGNLIKGIIDEASKSNPAIQYAQDAIASLTSLSPKDFMKNFGKAIYHSTVNKSYKEGVTEALREAMSRRGQIYMNPEVEALLNAKKIASTTFLGYRFGVEGAAWRRKGEEALFGLLKNPGKIIQSPEVRNAAMRYTNDNE